MTRVTARLCIAVIAIAVPAQQHRSTAGQTVDTAGRMATQAAA